MNLVNRIKKITYQFIRNKVLNFSDEEMVEISRDILNAAINDQSIIDSEMPTNILGVIIDWTVGVENDSLVEMTFGDYILQQDLTQPNSNVKIRMPTGFIASNNALEESIELTWDEVLSAVGYRVIRDKDTVNEFIVLDGNTGYSIDAGVVTFIDNVGDNAEHTYIVLAKDADPEDHSEFTEPIMGKGYSIFIATWNTGSESSTTYTSTSMMEGETPVSPGTPTSSSHIFVGWDDLSAMYADRTINAIWNVNYIGTTGPAGGIVFYDKGYESNGWRFMETCPYQTPLPYGGVSDTSLGYVWGGYNTILGTLGDIGTGYENTETIYTAYGNTEPYEGETNYAAKQCWFFNYGGYSDWFLPSRYEGLELINNAAYLDNYNTSQSYWTSTESSAMGAYLFDFNAGHANWNSVKHDNYRVLRPVRRF